jgi:hypothetical protein
MLGASTYQRLPWQRTSGCKVISERYVIPTSQLRALREWAKEQSLLNVLGLARPWSKRDLSSWSGDLPIMRQELFYWAKAADGTCIMFCILDTYRYMLKIHKLYAWYCFCPEYALSKCPLWLWPVQWTCYRFFVNYSYLVHYPNNKAVFRVAVFKFLMLIDKW